MSPPSLLLVDDSPEIGFVVQRLTRKFGQMLTICTDVPSAQERLQMLRPALILLDLNLPGKSGLELCKSLRSGTEHTKTPIALFGSAARPEDLIAALEAGVDYLVEKDLLASPDAWQARLSEILEMPGSHGSPHLLQYLDGRMSLALPRNGITAFNHALKHVAVLQRGAPVVWALLRRVLLRFYETLPNDGNANSAEEAVSKWLPPNRLELATSAVPFVDDPDAVAECAAALSDQFARIWGVAASRAARAALTEWMHV